MVCIETMLHQEMVKESHQSRREVDEAFFSLCQTLGTRAIFQPISPPNPDTVAMKLQVLNEQAEDFTHTEATLPHQQNNTAKLKIVDSRQKCFKIGIFYDLDALFWLFELDGPLYGFSTTGMNEKRLKATETLRNLLIDHRVMKRFSSLDVIAIEAAHGCDNGVDASLTEEARMVNGRQASLALWITEPLNKANEIVRRHLPPIMMNLL
ncbi:MAG TPA: hypothetical protein VFV38_48940 [Ktedonobacteraceae bacterium]|nr:hypothetical protein [Ktedonobacteraceae bacterium]